ncbi:hypothetical protein HK101_004552, partial [Irineochytrium annulatum]
YLASRSRSRAQKERGVPSVVSSLLTRDTTTSTAASTTDDGDLQEHRAAVRRLGSLGGVALTLALEAEDRASDAGSDVVSERRHSPAMNTARSSSVRASTASPRTSGGASDWRVPPSTPSSPCSSGVAKRTSLASSRRSVSRSSSLANADAHANWSPTSSGAAELWYAPSSPTPTRRSKRASGGRTHGVNALVVEQLGHLGVTLATAGDAGHEGNRRRVVLETVEPAVVLGHGRRFGWSGEVNDNRSVSSGSCKTESIAGSASDVTIGQRGSHATMRPPRIDRSVMERDSAGELGLLVGAVSPIRVARNGDRGSETPTRGMFSIDGGSRPMTPEVGTRGMFSIDFGSRTMRHDAPPRGVLSMDGGSRPMTPESGRRGIFSVDLGSRPMSPGGGGRSMFSMDVRRPLSPTLESDGSSPGARARMRLGGAFQAITAALKIGKKKGATEAAADLPVAKSAFAQPLHPMSPASPGAERRRWFGFNGNRGTHDGLTTPQGTVSIHDDDREDYFFSSTRSPSRGASPAPPAPGRPSHMPKSAATAIGKIRARLQATLANQHRPQEPHHANAFPPAFAPKADALSLRRRNIRPISTARHIDGLALALAAVSDDAPFPRRHAPPHVLQRARDDSLRGASALAPQCSSPPPSVSGSNVGSSAFEDNRMLQMEELLAGRPMSPSPSSSVPSANGGDGVGIASVASRRGVDVAAGLVRVDSLGAALAHLPRVDSAAALTPSPTSGTLAVSVRKELPPTPTATTTGVIGIGLRPMKVGSGKTAVTPSYLAALESARRASEAYVLMSFSTAKLN